MIDYKIKTAGEFMQWKIDEITIDNQVVIAPMAGVSNIPFRLIAKEMGAGLIYGEMVSDKALIHGNEKTFKMLNVDENEHPLTMQVFGGDINSIAEGAKIIDKHSNADIIDINMGCPVNKIVKSDAGAKLLLEPKKIYEIVAKVVDEVKKPVTVKMRTGWDKDHIYAVEIAKYCEQAGAKAIAIHGRTRSQMYEGQADWDIIKEVKENIKTIPVIGNGDVKTPEDAKRMLDTTGVDAVMIGRAALGNPWLIKRTITYLDTGELIAEPSWDEKIITAIKHMYKLVEAKGEKIAVLEMRSHASWYIKGIKNATHVKKLISQASTVNEMESILREFLISLS